jgi:hypothetical protein
MTLSVADVAILIDTLGASLALDRYVVAFRYTGDARRDVFCRLWEHASATPCADVPPRNVEILSPAKTKER